MCIKVSVDVSLKELVFLSFCVLLLSSCKNVISYRCCVSHKEVTCR